MDATNLPQVSAWAAAVAGEVRAEAGRRNINPPELAKLSGIRYRTLKRSLNGEREFTLSDLEALAKALEVPLGRFLLVGQAANTDWKSSRIRSITSMLRWSRPSLALAG